MTSKNGTAETFNGANEVSTVGGSWVTPVYDKAGNMTTMPQPGSETTGLTCVYDAWNRLVSISGGASITYCYDGLGRRVKEASGGHTTYYYFDGQSAIETRYDGAGSGYLQYQYVWSLRGVKTPLLRDGGTSGRIYYLSDANDNVTTVTNASGAVQEHYVYDAYGAVTICNASWGTTSQTSSVSNTLLFASMDLDRATGPTTTVHYAGLYYDEARWYSTSLSTFVTRDPIGYRARDLNLYRYADNNSLTRTDPSGREGTLTFTPDGSLSLCDPSNWLYFPAAGGDSCGNTRYTWYFPRNGASVCKETTYGRPSPKCTQAEIDADNKALAKDIAIIDATYDRLFERALLWRDTNLTQVNDALTKGLANCAVRYRDNPLKRLACETSKYLLANSVQTAIMADYAAVTLALGVMQAAEIKAAKLNHPCAD